MSLQTNSVGYIGLGWSMQTRSEVEKAAHLLGEERWKVWMNCGVHDWRRLPETDSGEHYCPKCWTLWTSDGAILHVPDQPSTVSLWRATS